MARRRELTISEEMELDWNDGMHSDDDEKYFREEFEIGWQQLSRKFASAGHTNLIFDPMRLVI